MKSRKKISQATRKAILEVFGNLEYRTLGPIYCYEGGEEFWKAKRSSCIRLGSIVAEAMLGRLRPSGRSLYVGAGVAEIPPLLMESFDLRRDVFPCNLRRTEVDSLNRTCRTIPLRFQAIDATKAPGKFDHVWIVSVLNDPERFPHVAPISYGRADPVTFDPVGFRKEREIVRSIVNRCLSKLSLPGLVTTSTEEVVWIADWCHRKNIPYLVGREQYRTALVGDPICFMQIGVRKR
ncbi:hypothetical protein [Petrachloros mirabilis]